jgi:hypothetical protein
LPDGAHFGRGEVKSLEVGSHDLLASVGGDDRRRSPTCFADAVSRGVTFVLQVLWFQCE